MPTAVFRTAEAWNRILLGGLIGRASMSDVADTSVVKTLCSAVAQCLDELSYNAGNLRLAFGIDTAAGPDLDARAAQYGVTRIGAVQAKASLTFSSSSQATATIIPAQTTVLTATGTVFTTDADATLTAGATSIPNVAATCQTPGIVGNVPALTLVQFQSQPVGISAVTNPAAGIGGQDQETDDSLRQRIKLSVAGLARGTPAALESAVLGAKDPATGDTILFAKVLEDPIARPAYSEMYIADAAGTNEGTSVAVSGEVLTASLAGPPQGSAQGGETRLTAKNRPFDTNVAATLTSSKRGKLTLGTDFYVNTSAGVFFLTPAAVQGEVLTATYSYFGGIIQLAQKIIDGDPSDRADFPGYRAAGTQCVVLSPLIIQQRVDCNVVVQDGYSLDATLAQAQVAIQNYLSLLGIGQNVIVPQLIAAIMGVPGVVDLTLMNPTSDVLTAPSQLIRPGRITVS